MSSCKQLVSMRMILAVSNRDKLSCCPRSASTHAHTQATLHHSPTLQSNRGSSGSSSSSSLALGEEDDEGAVRRRRTKKGRLRAAATAGACEGPTFFAARPMGSVAPTESVAGPCKGARCAPLRLHMAGRGAGSGGLQARTLHTGKEFLCVHTLSMHGGSLCTAEVAHGGGRCGIWQGPGTHAPYR